MARQEISGQTASFSFLLRVEHFFEDALIIKKFHGIIFWIRKISTWISEKCFTTKIIVISL
ncbi:hypothetical protein A0U92_06720 [Acetobacter aceti]|uniref:Uncharacterized protein n=1 Tax=Acetobacter aceti TaxID=435 RepID=A0A1U9KFG5_ACEAC|nr:hypothetical protein A0U92_06720 [Acetobacter aceti]